MVLQTQHPSTFRRHEAAATSAAKDVEEAVDDRDWLEIMMDSSRVVTEEQTRRPTTNTARFAVVAAGKQSRAPALLGVIVQRLLVFHSVEEGTNSEKDSFEYNISFGGIRP